MCVVTSSVHCVVGLNFSHRKVCTKRATPPCDHAYSPAPLLILSHNWLLDLLYKVCAPQLLRYHLTNIMRQAHIDAYLLKLIDDKTHISGFLKFIG